MFDLYDNKVRISVLAVLMGVSIALIFYFHFILHVRIIFTHFFYIPIILAAIWFKRKSLILTGILSFLLLASAYSLGFSFFEDVFRVLMFFFVNTVTIFLSEQIDAQRRQLEESEKKYRSLFELSPKYILVLNLKGKILDLNKATSELIGLKKGKLVGKSFELGFILPERIKEIKEKLKIIEKGSEVKPYETKLLDSKGNEHYVRVFSRLVKIGGDDLLIVVIEDLTDIKKTQKELEKTVKEKELLIKETYHRVKNNLMIISSLLSLQSRYLKDKRALELFKESENRARSMALIHERLYRSSNLKEIDIAEYLQTVASGIFNSYAIPGIKLNLDLDKVKMDVELAIPIGLIVNELVTNSLKHAFPEGAEGEVNLKLKSLNDEILLEVSDNGVGFPDSLDWQKTSSLGLQLVKSLSDQINADVEMISDDGTTFRIKVPKKGLV
ncbi:MAG TPA: histidine kinase dimerization/phosphoacceptor domain -containing protein [Methanothermobacter sp.]|nr:histidine kinase dimerization/phosphoacceptor domain -containing protein [Methanothermobacter sp.]